MGAQVAAAVSLWAASSSLQVGRSSCRSVLECRRHRSAAPRAVSLTTPLSSASTSPLLISLSLPCPLLLPGPPHVAVLDNYSMCGHKRRSPKVTSDRRKIILNQQSSEKIYCYALLISQLN